MGGEERSEYGLQIIKQLSKELTNLYGKGYDRGTLYRCLRFYKLFPEIVASVGQQSHILLSWIHYRILLQVTDEKARKWYEKEAFTQTWSARNSRVLRQTYNLAAYLIAQLGKNFNEKVKGRITGQELLEAAIRQAQRLQYQAGGMVVFVEADNKEKLLSFYENYGFKRFDTRQTVSNEAEPHELVQLLRLL